MTVSNSKLAGLCPYSRRQLAWRSLLAAPFTLSLVLALVLGPAAINNAHSSFVTLVGLSLVAAVLMFRATNGLLIPAGLALLLAFPLLAGLGFNFAPDLARPAVAIVFYGSMLASLAAALTGTVVVLRSVLRAHPRALAISAVCLALLAVTYMAGIASASSSGVALASDPRTGPANMGALINTGHREAEPSFTADGRTMYFNCNDYDICVSHLTGAWEEGTWTTPEIVGPPISTGHVEVEPVINATGDVLYFTSSRPFARGEGMLGLPLYVAAFGRSTGQAFDRLGVSLFGGLGEDDIWVSNLNDGAWSEPRKINDVSGEPPVNTAFNDHCLFFSADGSEAFWTSTRPGGFGGNDIWTSRRIDGRWTTPENLGPNVNGPENEHHPIPSPDGRSLYVTSDRPGGFGGEDIYVTTRGADGNWGPLVNLGQPINGPANDRCLAWTPDRKILLFDSDRAGGFGSKDIWWISSSETGGAVAR